MPAARTLPRASGSSYTWRSARKTTNRLYIIQYRYVFRDREGMELEPAMSWHRDAFRTKSTVYLKRTALNLDAVNYKLEVKWANSAPPASFADRRPVPPRSVFVGAGHERREW